MEGVLRRNPNNENHMDTYANLLYKAGKVKEAIAWQEKALGIAKKTQSIYIENLEKNLTRMKSGVPTWALSSSSKN